MDDSDKMPRKKSCEKHYRYVASCPDCRALNVTSDDEEDSRLYSDVDPDEIKPSFESDTKSRASIQPEIPRMNNESDSSRTTNRFKYERPPNPNLKRRLIIVGIIAVIVILIGVLYAYPVWHAKINLQQQMYDNKSDIDFWAIYTLNYWSIDFFFNKIGLIGALIGCVIMSLPPDDSLFKLLSIRFGWGNIKKWKSLVFWWTGGFIIFFIVGQSMENGYFALTMQLIRNNYLDSGSGEFFNALSALWDPSQVSEIEFYLYQSVTRPIMLYILGVIIFRIVLKVAQLAIMDRDELKIATLISNLIGIFFLIALVNRPLKAQNGLDLIRVWGIYLGIVIFFGLGLYLFILSRKRPGFHFDYLDPRFRKRSAIIAGSTLVILLLPMFISIPTSINLSNPDVWEQIEWDVRYSQQIEWTRTAAGISYGGTNYFETRDIESYTDSVISSDTNILNVIRQYDKEYSGKTMSRDIKNNYETMADSDIIYIPGVGEYWVAPKTLQIDVLLDDPKNEHTEIYDHAEGFIALDTSSGETVASDDYMDTFGVISKYPIFFGEKEDTSYSNADTVDLLTFSDYYAYDNDILLNTGWSRTTNATSVYEGEPDGELDGLEAFWYIMNMGLTTFALDSSFKKEFLINRNIRTRVSSVLMPGMVIDSDPYLVFNRENQTLYYAVSLYTEIGLDSYFYSPIYRFLGTVLVDVKTGELNWYKNPSWSTIIENDPLKDLWRIYGDESYYPWKNAADEDWLVSQLRYPETLWEKQLSVDYTYHVQDPRVWNSQSDFFKLPEGTDVFYIETDLGEGLEFVGVQLVEYNREEALKLTGLYVIRHGDHFGETVFFRALEEDNMIGPNTAKDELRTQATQEISLIDQERFGNTLLYPLAGSLYYYIPIYSQTGDYESFVGTGLVNAFTKKTYYGDTLTLAYNELALDLLLNDTTTPENETSDLSLDVDAPNSIVYSPLNWAEFETVVKYTNTNDSLPQRNVSLNLTIRSDVPMQVKLFNQVLSGVEYNFSETLVANNYSIAVWDGVNGLYPGQGHSLVVKMNPTSDLVSGIIVYYSFDLYDSDTGEHLSTGWQTITFYNSNL